MLVSYNQINLTLLVSTQLQHSAYARIIVDLFKPGRKKMSNVIHKKIILQERSQRTGKAGRSAKLSFARTN